MLVVFSSLVSGFSWKQTSECQKVFESAEVNIFDQLNGISDIIFLHFQPSTAGRNFSHLAIS